MFKDYVLLKQLQSLEEEKNLCTEMLDERHLNSRFDERHQANSSSLSKVQYTNPSISALSPSIYPSIHIHIMYLSTNPSIYTTNTHISICPHIHPSTHTSICFNIHSCLSIHLTLNPQTFTIFNYDQITFDSITWFSFAPLLMSIILQGLSSMRRNSFSCRRDATLG